MRNTSRKHRQKQHRIYVAGMIIAAAILSIVVSIMLLSHFGVFSKNEELDQDLFFDHIEIQQDKSEKLGYGLELQGLGRYAGLFLEDGSNDSVSDVMMIKIKNTGDKDLQLARLSLTYTNFTAEFELTNLPVGKTAVVLEKNRHAYSQEQHRDVVLSDVVHFDDQMGVSEEIYEISGLPGALNLKNRSDIDVSGDIYVYYKYIADDMLYGGITFRAKLPGGLRAGETKQLASSHFDPEQCIVLHISCEA